MLLLHGFLELHNRCVGNNENALSLEEMPLHGTMTCKLWVVYFIIVVRTIGPLYLLISYIHHFCRDIRKDIFPNSQFLIVGLI